VRHGKDLLGVLLAESRGGFGVYLSLGHRGERILRLRLPAKGMQSLTDAAEDKRVGRARRQGSAALAGQRRVECCVAVLGDA